MEKHLEDLAKAGWAVTISGGAQGHPYCVRIHHAFTYYGHDLAALIAKAWAGERPEEDDADEPVKVSW